MFFYLSVVGFLTKYSNTFNTFVSQVTTSEHLTFIHAWLFMLSIERKRFTELDVDKIIKTFLIKKLDKFSSVQFYRFEFFFVKQIKALFCSLLCWTVVTGGHSSTEPKLLIFSYATAENLGPNTIKKLTPVTQKFATLTT